MSTFNEGDIVRFKDPESLRVLPERGRWVTDLPFTLEDINVDGRWGDDGDETYAEGHLADYGSVEVWHPDEIELVMSAAAAAKRQMPTLSDLLDHVGSQVMSWGDGFEINGVDSDGPQSLRAYGKTDEGLEFSFVIVLGRAEERWI